jgi:methyl-accepting chemotaxis protein
MPPFTKKLSSARPPFLICVAGLAVLIAITGLLGYAAVHSADEFRGVTKSIQQTWSDRLTSKALPEQYEVRQALESDQQFLSRMIMQYQRLHHLLGFSITGLGLLILLAFVTYHYAVSNPLKNLERSIREIAEQGLRGKVWGTERDDLYGSLARSIAVLRKDVSQLADMSVEGPDGVHLVRFSGRGAAAFNTLINDLQIHVRDLQKSSQDMRERMEHSADHWQKKAEIMGDAVMQTSSSLHEAFENSRQQLEILHGSQLGVQNEAKRLVSRFEGDMEAIKEIALATGQRVAQTLTVLNASDRDLRRATQQNLEASDMFTAQASDLTEKLVVATNLMRASGKVMAETTETTRTRFLEAVQSVESHDASLRAFLEETVGKTDQIASLYDNLAGNNQRMNELVETLTVRVSDFDGKSNEAFGRIALGAGAMEDISGRLESAHGTLSGSMDTMRNHTDMLAQILATLRDEYGQTMDSVRQTIGEVTPAIAVLKDAGQNIHGQLQQEWSIYSQQSRQILAALEDDVRALNARTALVSQSTESLVSDIRSQTAHLNQSANNLDLQIGAISQRIEGAVSAVIHSNQQISTSTAGQMQEIHGAVNDMVQRLTILSQLTGTLGAVAGQLGQIVPALGAAAGHVAENTSAPEGASPAVAEKFEQLNKDFSGALQTMRGEFETIRGQITRWVEAISGGYQRMASQITGLENMLDEKLSSVKVSGLETMLDEKFSSIKLGGLENMLDEKLSKIKVTSPTPAELLAPTAEAIAGGYQYLAQQLTGQISTVTGQISTVENRLASMENRLSDQMASIKFSPEDLVAPTVEINALEIAGKLATPLQLIHETLAESSHAEQQMVDRIDKLRAELTSLRNQVQNSSGTLNEMNDVLTQGFEKLQSEEIDDTASSENVLLRLENITKELNVQTMVDAVSRLQHITQSLEKIAGTEGGPESDEKAG